MASGLFRKSISIISLIFIAITANTITDATLFCTNDDNTDNCTTNQSNKYTKDVNTKYLKYLSLIKEAKASYVPCDETKCNCHLPTILNDLKLFKDSGISKQSIDNIRTKGTKYQIINNRLYREKTCMFPARCSGIEHFLLDLLNTKPMPDMEFIMNTRDWPQNDVRFGVSGPVFSFSKTANYNDIMYPAWAFWEGGPAISLYPQGLGRWDNHREMLGRVGNDTSWSSKITKGFFRGSRTSAERDALVLLSRDKPDLVDAQFTKNQAWKSDADTLHAAPASEVSLKDHCKYKYLFNFRGVAASFRFKHILLCKSVVFHVGNDWLEFFYPALKPWIHYVPVDANADKRDLEGLLQFAVDNEEVVREIAENGYNMIWNNLKMKDVKCYWRKLLRKYAALLMYAPELDKDLMEIRKKNVHFAQY